MLSANQIAGFLNQVLLLNKLMKQPNFSHVDTNLQKLKVDYVLSGWAWSRMEVANLVPGL